MRVWNESGRIGRERGEEEEVEEEKRRYQKKIEEYNI